MATSATEIVNFALSKLGAKRIMDIDDRGDKKARSAKIHYAQARRAVLRRHPWNFAMKRVELSRLVEKPLYGFNYQFSLPSDHIRLVEVNGTNVFNSPEKSEFFEIEGGDEDSGLNVLGDFSTCQIKYIRDVTNTTRYDDLFTEAFTMLLASKMARAITGSDTREREMKDAYESIELPNGQHVDALETASNENHPLQSIINRSLFANARTPRHHDNFHSF